MSSSLVPVIYGSICFQNDGDTPGKKRKKIRKVIKDKNLKQETRDAARAEMDRRDRIKERQKLVRNRTNKSYDHACYLY